MPEGSPTAEARPRPDREHTALVVSMTGAAGFAGLGIVLGVVSGSQVILFDGFFSLLGVGLAWMALLASKVGGAEPTPRHPFGREGVAPLVIGIEGVALLATCAYAAFEAVATILAGGGEVVGGWGIVYAGISFVVPLGFAWWLRRASRSELVAAEATQWRAGAAFGLGMLVAFIAAQLLERTSRAWLAPYVDPTLVIVAAVVFVLPPLTMVRTMLRELLEAAPDEAVQSPVRQAVEHVSATHGLDIAHLRMAKVGTKLYIELDYVVDGTWTVARADEVRRALRGAMTDLHLEPWVTVEFTADPTWVD